MIKPLFMTLSALIALLLPTMAAAHTFTTLHLTSHWVGYSVLALFGVAYLLVMTEEVTHLKKSKPVILAAGLMWGLLAIMGQKTGQMQLVDNALQLTLLEYLELLLFLLVAMTYINAMEERCVFDALRQKLMKKPLSYRQIFWLTGLLAFFISPVADNLTTALLMCTVVMAMAPKNTAFIATACINIVIAANAGGAFSPFGDITTLMVWQQEHLTVTQFLNLFLPALISFVLPGIIMSMTLPKEQLPAVNETSTLKPGGLLIVGLFLATIITAIIFHSVLKLSAAIGMMTGLAYLQLLGFRLTLKSNKIVDATLKEETHFDVFERIQRAEWDTLLFFYGIMMCVGALATLGYLEVSAHWLYGTLGQGLPEIHQATPANCLLGLLSAIIDNIPVMFAVLSMSPVMSDGQWLLVTLTAGIGGSLLSVGSAAGVALMGHTKGIYSFTKHLKWTPVIFLGYAAGVLTHLYLNANTF